MTWMLHNVQTSRVRIRTNEHTKCNTALEKHSGEKARNLFAMCRKRVRLRV